MDSLRYLLVLLGCLAITLPLEFALGARVWRRPGRLVRTLLPVVAAFGVWDLIATARGDWWFAARYTIGLRILGLPIEEWLFFLVIPVCAVLTYEAFGRPAARAGSRAGARERVDADRGR